MIYWIIFIKIMRYIFALICCIGNLSFLPAQEHKLRSLADTIGFAHTAVQMDSVMKRLVRMFPPEAMVSSRKDIKVMISPHDDYAYVSNLYPLALSRIKAPIVILIGVAHKARTMGIENKMIFDSYTHWKGPYREVKVASIREDIIAQLPKRSFEVNDSLQKAEHSVEAIIPFLQYYNPQVQIVSILVPAMPYQRMDTLSAYLAGALQKASVKNKLQWGRDIVMIISNDAVHYGDEGWNGRNFARYGADSAGYLQAGEFEQKLMRECLEEKMDKEKIRKFTQYTVKEEDFREYQWTWCGRYSVPFGLLTAIHWQKALSSSPIKGTLLGYGNSLNTIHIPVEDLGLGVTAPFTIRHWVAYAVIGYSDGEEEEF
jgi:AmmeMemoRadiSam system protein B